MLSRRELLGAAAAGAAAPVPVPKIEGEWWTLARDPDLGPLNGPPAGRPDRVQQPVDFAIWQAADGRWQLWSCIRHTRCGGQTRLFYRWQGERLTDADWRPMGIAMQADPGFGETQGGLQAPFVLTTGGLYYMFYGDWENICSASSEDGKTFARRLQASGKAAMFGEGPGNNTRDPMVLRAGRLWHCYYTAYPEKKGAVYCRTSRDLHTWSEARIVASGGRAGSGPFSAECPFVARRGEWFYLFRTQRYGSNAQTSVYRSRDPLDFGVGNDRYFLTTLPVAAPEIVTYGDRDYLAALAPDLKGIRMARLDWAS
ncbi:MAG: hypothetical protein IT158_09970 [Bryobacterales bacterium]|nr:hypothetical protein [Bryobacterales bacterium]